MRDSRLMALALAAGIIEEYTLAEIKAMKTIHQGQYDNLKQEEKGKAKVWLSRLTVADGMPYNNQITVEVYDATAGRWNTAKEYEAK